MKDMLKITIYGDHLFGGTKVFYWSQKEHPKDHIIAKELFKKNILQLASNKYIWSFGIAIQDDISFCHKIFYQNDKEIKLLSLLLQTESSELMIDKLIGIIFDPVVANLVEQVKERSSHELFVSIFEVASNPTISLDEIRNRRYYIVDRVQIRAKDSILKNEPIKLPEDFESPKED